jgi:hypothetical protein
MRFYNHPIAPISVSNEGAAGLDFSSTADGLEPGKRPQLSTGTHF